MQYSDIISIKVPIVRVTAAINDKSYIDCEFCQQKAVVISYSYSGWMNTAFVETLCSLKVSLREVSWSPNISNMSALSKTMFTIIFHCRPIIAKHVRIINEHRTFHECNGQPSMPTPLRLGLLHIETSIYCHRRCSCILAKAKIPVLLCNHPRFEHPIWTSAYLEDISNFHKISIHSNI